jgi:hypothetical protein
MLNHDIMVVCVIRLPFSTGNGQEGCVSYTVHFLPSEKCFELLIAQDTAPMQGALNAKGR